MEVKLDSSVFKVGQIMALDVQENVYYQLYMYEKYQILRL